MTEFVDSHAHLDRDVYDADRGDVLARARAAGVRTIVNIGLGPDEEALRRAYDFTRSEPGIYLAVGVHPHDVSGMTDATIPFLRELCSKEKVVAVGEIGLDYHYEHSPRQVQRARFRELLGLAIDVQLPVILHSREASADLFDALQETGLFSKVGGVFHCFGGDAAEAERAVRAGAYVGFAGIVTFKKAENVKAAARSVPLERILIETDAPFLAPEPFRGKRNEPAFVVRVAEVLAQVRGVSVEEIARITTANARALFRLPEPPA